MAIPLTDRGLRGRLAIGTQKRHAMAVACGIDTNADTVQSADGRHKGSPQATKGFGPQAEVSRVAREPVSLLRYIFGQAILVISGRCRMMYPYHKPKPEGTIFSKRSKPQGSDRTPHDATTIMTGG